MVMASSIYFRGSVENPTLPLLHTHPKKKKKFYPDDCFD
jgi:hypothetical protein